MSMIDIRALRQERKMKQRDLATLAGVTPRALMQFERGLVTPDRETLANLCHALGIDGISRHARGKLKKPVCGEGYVTNTPVAPVFRRRTKKPARGKRSVIDLFCGVGGFSFGFEMTGHFEVTAGVDLLSDRLDTFVANHPHANAYGQDIRALSLDEIDNDNPRPFVIVGGPPCQGFSSLRPFRNVEWSDPRNNLAEEFVRIVAGLQPEWVVFENVVGLLTHERGKTWKAIVAALEDAGYLCSMKVLNAAFHGLPQKRERFIIVGNRRKKAFKWPAPTHTMDHKSMAGSGPHLHRPEVGLFAADLPPAVTLDEAIHDLPPLVAGQRECEYLSGVRSTTYEAMIRNGAGKLELHEATAHSPEMINIIRHAGANINALPPGMVTSGFSSCYSRLAADEPSTTITVNFVHPASNRCIHPWQDRALSPREGARLQGFFDNFSFRGSRTQIVKQIGNAVPPLLGRAIALAILDSE